MGSRGLLFQLSLGCVPWVGFFTLGGYFLHTSESLLHFRTAGGTGTGVGTLCFCTFSLSVPKAGRGASCAPVTGTHLKVEPFETHQLQSKADFYAALVSLANLRQAALGDKGMTKVLDLEYCISTTLVIHKISFMARTWEAFTSPTWISRAGRQIPDPTWREDWGCGHCTWSCLCKLYLFW